MLVSRSVVARGHRWILILAVRHAWVLLFCRRLIGGRRLMIGRVKGPGYNDDRMIVIVFPGKSNLVARPPFPATGR